MVNVWVRHKVSNFDQWKKVFDSNLGARKAGGQLSCRVFYSEDDARDVVLFFEWSSRVAAESFLSSAQASKGMSDSGVAGEVEIVYAQESRSLRRTAAD